MLRIRVTFSVTEHLGTVTHELLVNEVDEQTIKARLNEEMMELRTLDNKQLRVKDILLIVDLPDFSTHDPA